jgi:hypothetical protein
MKTLKIFVTLFVLMVVALTTAQAQTRRAAEWKQRVANEIAAGARPQPAAQTETATPAAEHTPNAAEAANDAHATATDSEFHQDRIRDFIIEQKNALAGTWDLTLTFSDGSQVKSTLNVALGRRPGEGSVIHSAEATLLLPNPTTSEQGAWEHVNGRRFIASYKGFAVDAKFESPAGKIGFRHSIRLHSSGESFTGEAVFEVLDLEGKVVFSDNIKTEGKRQHAEAP